MNVAFFIIPKHEVAFVYDYFTMRQALEKMEFHRYSAIPILTKVGEYVGTLNEGDLLWKLKHTSGLDFSKTEDIPLKEVPLQRDVKPISIRTDIEKIYNLAIDQNFIPIIDDSEIFIGIIRRRELIEYMYKKLIDKSNEDKKNYCEVNL
ncbi:CBS domain-containing protein [Brevibacillus sp. AY1]|uniref:CBS domain-containing protein n=1 Tax=Brevibacillus sp. AY1 TaxID=2807621 RepID=UPI0024545690|nr:CBS domain-containing protein [Brevibacillus sp. AY1]MDH4620086.1 CBS domain-containing protein [Brevibacillus sp. AY1]